MSLYNVNTLRNDFHFLEDAQQSKQRAKRVLESQNTLLTDCRGQNAEAYFRANAADEGADGRRGPKRARKVNNNLDFLLLGGAGEGEGKGEGVEEEGTEEACIEPSVCELAVSSSIAVRRGAVRQVLDNYSQHVRQLVLAARARGTDVILLSPGMFKRNANSSRVVWARGAVPSGAGGKGRRNRKDKAAAGAIAANHAEIVAGPSAEPIDSIFWRVHLVFLLTSSEPPATPAQGHGGPISPTAAAGSDAFSEHASFLADQMLKLSLHGGNSSEVKTFSNPAAGEGPVTSHIQLETHCIGVALDNVDEDSTVESLVAGVLGNREAQYYAVRQQLRFLRGGTAGAGAAEPRCLIQQLPQPPGGRKSFLAVRMQDSLRAALQDKTLMEYPTLFVSTREYLAGFHCLVQEE